LAQGVLEAAAHGDVGRHLRVKPQELVIEEDVTQIGIEQDKALVDAGDGIVQPAFGDAQRRHVLPDADNAPFGRAPLADMKNAAIGQDLLIRFGTRIAVDVKAMGYPAFRVGQGAPVGWRAVGKAAQYLLHGLANKRTQIVHRRAMHEAVVAQHQAIFGVEQSKAVGERADRVLQAPLGARSAVTSVQVPTVPPSEVRCSSTRR
jgi:hypothetical protein